MAQSGIYYFGFSELIFKLKKLNDEKIIICSCQNADFILKIYLTNEKKLIGTIGVKKTKLSDAEKKITR